MDLGKLNRDAEDRSVAWGAVVACVIAAVTLTSAGLAAAAGDRPGAAVFGVIGLLQLGLAYGVYRGSLACAIAVLALWMADRGINILIHGPAAAANVWTVVFTVMLFAGMRGTFAQKARRASVPAGSAR